MGKKEVKKGNVKEIKSIPTFSDKVKEFIKKNNKKIKQG